MKLFLIALLLFSANCILGQSNLTVEKIWKTYDFRSQSVNGFSGMNDGQHYTQFSEIDQKSVISKHKIVDQKADAEVLVDLTTLKMDGKTLNVDNYEFNADESKMLFTTNTASIYRRSFLAEYYVYDLKSKKLDYLDKIHSPQTLAEYSPNGEYVAYIFENNIYVKQLSKGKVTQLTNYVKRNEIINGTTDWVYEEEFGITKGYDWSPDSKSIAYLKFDESNVKEFTMTYYNELYPDLYTFKYPKAGEDNSKVMAFITSIEHPKSISVDLGEYEYIPRISWSNNASDVIFQTLNRHQNHVKYNLVSWNGTTASSKVFFEEKSETYVEIDNNLIFLNDNKSILRTSEKDGFNHIYKIGFDGSNKQITKGSWDVIEFLGIDNANKFIYYTAAKSSAINKGIYKISIDGNKDLSISPEIGQSDAEFVKGMNYFVLAHSTANTPATYTLCDNTGKSLRVMEENKALKSVLTNYSLSKKEFMEFQLEGRTLNGWMMKPHNFDPTKKYPVYIAIYGGPGHNTVSNGWGGQDYMYHQLLTQEGYIVVSVDPRGTMYRGANFKKSTYLQLGKLETEDFIDVAKQLQQLNFVDRERIGIQGWSYGGFMASLAITKGADIFKTGIAVAPVTNWRYYDNIYTERFMRTPAENEDGYDQNSPIHFVQELKGNYFLIHGSGDDNVHYQNSMEMINALVKANKQFDLFIYPNKDHGIYGGNTRNHLFNMLFEYTKNNL